MDESKSGMSERFSYKLALNFFITAGLAPNKEDYGFRFGHAEKFSDAIDEYNRLADGLRTSLRRLTLKEYYGLTKEVIAAKRKQGIDPTLLAEQFRRAKKVMGPVVKHCLRPHPPMTCDLSALEPPEREDVTDPKSDYYFLYQMYYGG